MQMINKAMKYEKYKDSGVEWLGEIPSHWEVLTVKRFGKTKAGGTPSTTNLKFWDGNIPWLPSGKLQNCEINTAEKFITVSGLKNSATKLIKPNTTMIALTGATCANIGYLKFEACANQSVIAIEEYENVNSKFLYYALINERNQILLSQTGGAQAGINETDVKNIILPTPTYTEQTAIAAFLDRKTALVDQAINIKQKQIELLKERRQILIHKAVTRGVTSSEVEMPNVKLKDSGVEWIGEIPEGWSISKLGFYSLSIQTGPFGSQLHSHEYIENGVAVINPSHIIDGEIVIDNLQTISLEKYQQLKRHTLNVDDIVFGRRGEMGRCAMIYETKRIMICGTGSLKIELDKQRIFTEYLNLYLKMEILKNWFSLNSVGTTMENLNSEILGNVPILIPPKTEQIEIAQYIQNASQKIATAISLKEQEIEKLKEYKASLINSAVTGKIKVEL